MGVIKRIEKIGLHQDEVIKEFIKDISAKQISPTEFIYQKKKWFIDVHVSDHSDDIIVSVDKVQKYDRFLLIKSGRNRVEIAGWCTKQQLLDSPARDIYRNGKLHHMVNDVNIKDLEEFGLKDAKKIKQTFIINQQKADNLGHKEMINGVLAGLHSFAKQANVFFRDINQKDECILGDKKVKIYTRDAMSDEDMLLYDDYFKAHPEIDIYITCKIKGGAYWYVGYITKNIAQNTRLVQNDRI